MERGPLALFGAIIAVGLGPALWMGVQLGGMPTSPARPPAVVTEKNKVTGDQLVGGTGAGEQTTDSDDSPVDTAPQGNVLPMDTSPAAEPTPSATTSPSPSLPITTPTVSASTSASASASTGTGASTTVPATPPAETTTTTPPLPPTEPTDPSTTEPTDPATPPTGDETDDPSWPPYPGEDAGHGDTGGETGWDGTSDNDRAGSWLAADPTGK
ncbi:hypothetical protein [Paractinoplanes deccanensis]|nr:hypothetical protein [Actinoplanes deccanensis]